MYHRSLTPTLRGVRKFFQNPIQVLTVSEHLKPSTKVRFKARTCFCRIPEAQIYIP